jgi:probable HAF family extracellular repeat protein
LNIRCGIAACITLITCARISAADVSYSITDLGTFGGVSSFVTSINNSGHLVGWYEMSDGSRSAFLYDHGQAATLGTLGGTYTIAKSINDLRQIVGISYTGTNRPFIYQNGVMSDLIPNGPEFYPTGINDSGQISGYTSAIRASLFSNGTITDLGTPSGYLSFAEGINNRGDVVGNYDRPGPFGAETRAFVHSGGKLIDLGTLYGNTFLEVPFTSAEAINELGQIVGRGKTAANKMHAFLYSGGVIHDLGTMGGQSSQAYGINNLGQVVGEFAGTPPERRAFVYRDGVMSDLNDLIEPTSGWTIQWARDINDLGDIAAVGLKDGVSRGVILTPIPEPTELILVLPVWLLLTRRRSKVELE